ncbi:ATP-binding cassette domain-containing protein, partial [Rhizobiaceae sp. 2RAB30]
MVKFENVSKSFGAFTVLDDLCVNVMPGERVSIIGPSGSGKTTVLRALMTLDEVSSGMIWVDGVSITHMKRKGGWVPANERHRR